MQHNMKLQLDPFLKIKEGTKTIEMRLYDDKRKNIKVGDTITFTNLQTLEEIVCKVKNLFLFETFEELYKHFDKIKLGYNIDEIASFEDMEKYYSKDEQKSFGVVGIEVELL